MISILPHSDDICLGLGCSRLGSVNGTNGDEARHFLRSALDQGIRFFDTSNIYAQGDSEQFLGEIIGNRVDCVVCSKGGKFLSLPKRLLVPFKGSIRALSRRSSAARQKVVRARTQPMPTRWDDAFLVSSLDASLKRLKRDRIDIYMLHSPPAEVLKQGDAIALLDAAREAGKIGRVGVSADNHAAVSAALDDPRVEVLQLPLHVGDISYNKLIDQARRQRVAVVARGILGGPQPVTGAIDLSTFAAQRISEMVARADIALPLIGTTNVEHLQDAVAAARGAIRADN